ncbi:hypothetical protein [Acinetobacter sp.]|uniref:hypothetical protein n=1 Tax=Acinetobacter sp. TaxID=472 RepID=UPI003D04546F
MTSQWVEGFPGPSDPQATEHPCDYCALPSKCPIAKKMAANPEFVALYEGLTSEKGVQIGPITATSDALSVEDLAYMEIGPLLEHIVVLDGTHAAWEFRTCPERVALSEEEREKRRQGFESLKDMDMLSNIQDAIELEDISLADRSAI